MAHAVSGASLSRFSSRYFTSDMSKQPALLNSDRVEDAIQERKGLELTWTKFQCSCILLFMGWFVSQSGCHDG